MLGPHEYVGRRAQMNIFPTKILLAIDGSEIATHVTQAAVELSKKTDSELHVLYVGEDPYSAALSYPGPTDPEGVKQADPALVEELERLYEQEARQVVDAEVVDLAEELGVGLVVVGSRGLGGIRRALIGSVSDSVVRHAHCPVLVVRK